MKQIIILYLFLLCALSGKAQSPLFIPPLISGDTFQLNVQNGTTQFYPGINTPTYGVNGPLLGPTLEMVTGHWINLNVTNNLTGTGNTTTMHWHGLHVPARFDGGPHQIIPQGSTWSIAFTLLNAAGTYWYHPHGNGRTDLQVAKGIAGMILIRDGTDVSLNLPRTYGVDDFPVVVQTKAFDVLNQIAIATEMDTTVCVNGVVHPYLDVPAQVVRLRLLNGSSMRSYQFGFSGNHAFHMIAVDEGFLDSSLTRTRIRLSPGERAEILLDLQGMNGDSLSLIAYNSELPNGVYGAATVSGMMGGTIPDYNLNPLNGLDFEILKLHVVAPTANPVNSLPSALVAHTPPGNSGITRVFNLDPDSMMNAQAQVAGPFSINGKHFDMDSVNVITWLNSTEKWRIVNRTGIAHPFHIHDEGFYISSINGGAVPDYERGKKDVVLVMPQEYVEFVVKFEDFADPVTPYMYHCHLLHHEDDGMMGSFLVVDSNAVSIASADPASEVRVFPVPGSGLFHIEGLVPGASRCQLYEASGRLLLPDAPFQAGQLDLRGLPAGLYWLRISGEKGDIVRKLVISGAP